MQEDQHTPDQTPSESFVKPVIGGAWSRQEVEDLMNAVEQNKDDKGAAFLAISRKYGRPEANVSAKYYFEMRARKNKRKAKKEKAPVKKKAAKQKTPLNYYQRQKLKQAGGPMRILPETVAGTIKQPSPISTLSFSSSGLQIQFDPATCHVELAKGVVRIIYNQ